MNRMQRINALSLTSDAKDWLTNSQQPRILHVFDSVCNLINEHREVLSVVTQEIGNGPFNLVIGDDLLFSDYLSIQFSISSSAHQLRIGELTIHTADAKLWSPRPDWEMLHARRDDVLNQLMSLRARANERINLHHRPGIDSLQRTSALLAMTLPQLPFTNCQSPVSNSLISALANADLSSSLTAARHLAGLGIGLTPAGDDFIMGALLAVWIIHPFEIATDIAKEIANTAAPLTTSLSAAWLKSAGNGEAGILWHEFFDALIDADIVQIQTAMDKILAVGETSGADALAGFIGTFISYADSEKKLCHS